MIQISIPPTAHPPSNSERPKQDPPEESGFDDILQASVAEEPSVPTPASSSRVANAATQPSVRKGSEDSDLAEEESSSGAAAVMPPLETPQPASSEEDLSVELEELPPVVVPAGRGEILPVTVAERDDGAMEERLGTGLRSQGVTTDRLLRHADESAVVQPASAAPKAILPHAPLSQNDAPPTAANLPASEVPDELETEASAMPDVVSPSARQTKPTAATADAKGAGQGRVETSRAGEPTAGSFQESFSDSSKDPASSRERSAPRPVAGGEITSGARPTNQALPQPSNAPASHPTLDVTAPGPVEAGPGSSSQIRAEALIEQVRVHAKPGHSQIAFRLDPPRLGRLSIRLVMRGGRLLGQVRTETQEAAHLLRSGIEGLRSTMREAGIHVDRLEFQAAPGTSSHSAQEDLRDGLGRGTDWGDAPRESPHRNRGPRGEIRIERAILDVRNETEDGRLNVVA